MIEGLRGMRESLRKGARSRSHIPPKILADLNRGRLATANLVEWLAVDMGFLLCAVLPELGFSKAKVGVRKVVEEISALGVTKRLEGIGSILFRLVCDYPEARRVFEKIAVHRSDVVRQWGAYTIAADRGLSLPARLKATRPFAADQHMSVRECAWMAVRPYLAADLQHGIELLKEWVHDSDPNIRRFATEVTRPRGVWCCHISYLKQHPEAGLVLLEPLYADPSRYVQQSVANWLNDASKSQPHWTRSVCSRWLKKSNTRETAWIVRRALRTLQKT